jgi:hypothetical protein
MIFQLSLITLQNWSSKKNYGLNRFHRGQVAYIPYIVTLVYIQYTPSVSTIIHSGPTYSSQNVRQIWESTLSKSDYLVGHFGLGRTWEWILKAFFSATIDDRNLIFGHKHHIGTSYHGKRFWTHQIPSSCFPTWLVFIHIEHICGVS